MANVRKRVSQPTERTDTIADRLRQAAELIEEQHEGSFRAAAYRRAGDSIERTGEDKIALRFARGGPAALTSLPGVGRAIAGAIEEMLQTGGWTYLDTLRRGRDPVAAFQRIPGLGPALARRIHDALGVATLEDLELAANDGRLSAVPGIGARRALGVQAALAGMLRRGRRASAPSGAGAATADEPSVEQLLAVDRAYREAAASGRLPTIAPRRFNPRHEAWLPMMRARRGRWRYTALFSNTARAHELGKTRDWVVIYFADASTPAGGRERQRTVATESRGPLAGKRVVRGREAESPVRAARRHAA